MATASRVVNGQPDVASETREVVERVAREQGYSPRSSSPARGRTGLVGVTMPFTAPAYFAALVQGTTEALYEHGMRAVLCPTRHQHDREASLLDELSNGSTDGALLMLPEESNDELAELSAHGYRFVVVDPLQAPSEGIASVSASNIAAGAQATNHLLALGHRRIGVIAGPAHFLASADRVRGHHAALVAAGVSSDPALVVHADFLIDGGKAAALHLLSAKRRPSAIFAGNDQMALGVLHAARELGLSVPRDLSVVGVDDTWEAAASFPPLTTVRQPLAEMGRMAVELLLRMLERRRYESLHVELQTTLVERSSTAPPP